jgi:hypothetical protein
LGREPQLGMSIAAIAGFVQVEKRHNFECKLDSLFASLILKHFQQNSAWTAKAPPALRMALCLSLENDLERFSWALASQDF